MPTRTLDVESMQKIHWVKALLVLQGGPSLADDPADLLKYLGLDVGVLNEVAEAVFEVGCGGVRA